MGLLSDDMRAKALLRLKTAEVKGKHGRFSHFLVRVMNKFFRLSNQVGKKAQSRMDERRLVWKQYTTRKKEFARDVKPYLNRERFDIVLAHDSKAIAPTLSAAKAHNAVLGFDLVENTFANLRGFKPGFFTKHKLRKLENQISKAGFIISGDPYLSKQYKGRHAKVDPILVLNGQESDLPLVEQSLRDRIGDNSNRPIVLYIGVIAINRGIEQIINAMAKVKTDCLCALVGPGNPAYRHKISTLINDLGLGNTIMLMDGVAQEEVIPLSRTATIGISPISLKTGNAGLVLNNKMFQYIAAGIPVLSTNVPGPGGFIKRHAVGYIYSEDDIDDLARVIDLALTDVKNNHSILKNLKYVANKYSWESQRKILEDYIALTEKNHGLSCPSKSKTEMR